MPPFQEFKFFALHLFRPSKIKSVQLIKCSSITFHFNELLERSFFSPFLNLEPGKLFTILKYLYIEKQLEEINMWFVKWILLVALMQFLNKINCHSQNCDIYPPGCNKIIGERTPPYKTPQPYGYGQ